MNLGNVSKLVGAGLGNIVAIFLSWLAVQFPSISECTVGADGVQLCTVLGFTQAQITAALMTLFNMAFVYYFPPNKPPA